MANSPAGSSQEQEFMVRIPPRNARKKYHMMKFNASLNIDTSKWSQVRMVRENNRREFVREEEEQPEFGAGSEFGRKEKEEARRKKYGINTRKYNPDNQPWLMRVGSKKEGKQYKGIREGGISENTAYYVFTHAADGSFEAHPVKEWYNFTPRVTYRTLNAEEAEEKFAERGKILNHFAIMVSKKLRPNQDDAEDLDDEGGKGKKGKAAGKELKVSDMDDWVDSEDGLDSDSDNEKKKKDSDDEEDDGKGKKNARSKDSKKGKKKRSKDDVDDEAFEDSDDGDEEGLEVDYMSDESSESEHEKLAGGDIKGVDQDKGLARMLDSESSSDSENEDKKKDEKDEEKPEDEASAGKKGKKKKDDKSDEKGGKRSTKSSANNSRATTPTPGGSQDPNDKGDGSQGNDEKTSRAEKRKAMVDNLLDPNADLPANKKMRPDPFSSSSTSSSLPPPPANSIEAAFEEDVRRYLMRKPMTTTELLKKFKSKKTGLPKDELMPVLVNVLKRINPHKQKIKGTMYLSLKADK